MILPFILPSYSLVINYLLLFEDIIMLQLITG